ncbi:17245_t:CDS:1, partial [Racocetra fulgida]
MAAPKISTQIPPSRLSAHTDSSPSSFISSVNSSSSAKTSTFIPPGEDIPLSENVGHNSYSRDADAEIHNNIGANNSSDSLQTNVNPPENSMSPDEEE